MILDYPYVDSLPVDHDGIFVEAKLSRTEQTKKSVKGYEITAFKYDFYPQKHQQDQQQDETQDQQQNQQIEQESIENLTGVEAYNNCHFLQDGFDAWQQIFAYDDAKTWAEFDYEGSCPDSVKAYAKINEFEHEQFAADKIIKNTEMWFDKIKLSNDMILNCNG